MRYENILSKIHLHKIFYTTAFQRLQLLCSSRLFEADPSPALRATAVWPKRIESNFSRCAATHPPEGKATHCILSRLRLLTARLSATHNNLSVASLLQIVFAAVTAVRCAPLTRSPNRLRDESVSLDFRSPSAPYSTAISDSRQFVRRWRSFKLCSLL